MAPETIEIKVQRLEDRVTRLEELPATVDDLTSQVLQLRTEMRAEFSAVRDEMRGMNEQTVATLRDEIRAGDAETRRFMLILHEKLVSNIATLGEVRQTERGTRPKKKPRS